MIRDVFASTPDAKARGYRANRFSFNVKGGRCEACSGDGIIKIEMHFLSDVYVPCEVCHGHRYNRETLEVRYKGKNIYEVLEMTVDEALDFFRPLPRLANKLQTMHDVGLGYVKLGQPSTTLSGGEAQRIKLATELSRKATGRTLYILDEPTTGLHVNDVERLDEVLQRLADGGNTLVIIEHNLDVIKTADYIVDLGPEGGDRGGTVVVKGTPEQVAACRTAERANIWQKYWQSGEMPHTTKEHDRAEILSPAARAPDADRRPRLLRHGAGDRRADDRAECHHQLRQPVGQHHGRARRHGPDDGRVDRQSVAVRV